MSGNQQKEIRIKLHSIEEALEALGHDGDPLDFAAFRPDPDLASVPEPVEVVDIFRRAEDVPPVVREAIAG